jgi:hypothetical protein
MGYPNPSHGFFDLGSRYPAFRGLWNSEKPWKSCDLQNEEFRKKKIIIIGIASES